MLNLKISRSLLEPQAVNTSQVSGINLTLLLLSVLPLLIGLTGLIGWQFDIPQLKSVIPGAVEMKVNTGIGLVLASFALLIFGHSSIARLQSVGVILALIVALLGVMTALEYALKWNLGIDEWLFRDQAKAFNYFPGRMSPYTAACFILIGSGLLFSVHGKGRKWITGAALVVSVIATISLLSYFWNATELTTDRWAPPIAIHTAFALLLLGIGIIQINQQKDLAAPVVTQTSIWSIEKKVLAGFVFALLLILILGGYTYRSTVEYAKSAEWVDHSQKVRTALSELNKSVIDAEAAQRNYIITGLDSQLVQYQASDALAREQYAFLLNFVADNPEQLNNLKDMGVLIDQRLNGLSWGVKVFQEKGLASISTAIANGRGLELMQKIKNLSQSIAKAEEGLGNERQEKLTNRGTLTLISLLFTVTLATGVLVMLYLGVRREMSARNLAETNLVSTNRFLDSIFENIPSMIFIKDAKELRYVQLNRAGENLLGVSRQDLIGKNYDDFYRKEKAEAFFARDQEILKTDRIVDIPEETVFVPNKGKRYFHTIRIPLHDTEGNPTYLLGMTEDITERKLAEEKIKALNVALTERAAEVEASNKELESFSYSISHDLRAPLRHVQGYVQMLLEDCGDSLPSEPQRYLDVIAKSSQEMGELIDNLLNFSRMSRTVLHKEKVDLTSIIQDAIAGLEMSTQNRNIEWRIGQLPKVFGDQAMLKQVLVNLISNAIKYTAPRDPAIIEIGLKDQDERWSTMYVKDNGVGFEMQYASKLFGVFQRLHRADEFEGTGIGLANVQRIINRHGGKIWAEAELNKGACFYFTLANQPDFFEETV